MAKQNEIAYLDAWLEGCGAEPGIALEAQRNKPFAFGHACGGYLIDIGTIMKLLPPAPARILDLGVGTGWTSVMYARNGYDVVGQDIAPAMIALAEKSRVRNPPMALRFVVSDYETMGMIGEFDGAVFYDSLHHAVDEAAALRAVFRALRPGGVLVTLEPGEGHSTNEETLREVAKFGVTEKDMPPHRILAVGAEVGFRSVMVYAHRSAPGFAYEQDNPPPPPPPPPPVDRRGKLRRAGSFVMGAWRVLSHPLPIEATPRPVEDPSEKLLRSRNIVVLRKPVA